MNAPKMSHTVELLYPDSAQVRAALAGRKPASDNCCGLNSAKRPRTVTNVMPIIAMAAPGNGSRIRPTITPTKMEKKYHAWRASPEGTGSKARRTAIATGANAFHIGVVDLLLGAVFGVVPVPLDGAAGVALLTVAFESPISALFKIDYALNT